MSKGIAIFGLGGGVFMVLNGFIAIITNDPLVPEELFFGGLALCLISTVLILILIKLNGGIDE